MRNESMLDENRYLQRDMQECPESYTKSKTVNAEHRPKENNASYYTKVVEDRRQRVDKKSFKYLRDCAKKV